MIGLPIFQSPAAGMGIPVDGGLNRSRQRGSVESSGGVSTRLGNEDRERVREASPIEQVISDYGVALRQDGRNFKALCPFHREKTPSFKVDPERGTYRCFGCGEHGDVFSFVEKVDSLDFRGALTFLAERAGIELSGRRGPSPRRDQREADRQLIAWAAQWFERQRKTHAGEVVRDYLNKRGFEDGTIDQFGVGFAPAGWGALTDAMRGAQLDLDRGVRLGLLKRSAEGRVYDAFRQRVIFPIRSTQGLVIGFGGRHLDLPGPQDPSRNDPPPKYINSPESDLFHKGSILYGHFEGRDSIRSQRHLLLMEGYTDVMMAHQAGFSTAVATLGTALTEANVERVARFADRVTLVFDGDRAGIAAAHKAALLFASRKTEARVALLDQGEDPAELLVQSGGEDRFREIVANGMESLEFVLERCFDGEDEKSAGGRDRAARAFYEYVDRLPSAIVQGTALERLAESVGQPFATVERDFRARKNSRLPRRELEDAQGAETRRAGSLPAEEEGILLAALTEGGSGSQIRDVVFRLMPPDQFSDPVLSRLAERISNQGSSLDPLSIDESDEKKVLLELLERRTELKIDGDNAMRLLVELVRRHLKVLAQAEQRSLTATKGAGGTDASVLMRRILEIRRVGAEIGARPPQDPEALVEILDRFESGPLD